jgi:hypothetical protein
MPTAYEIVRHAIINKQQIVATYNGYRREMCPHAIGRARKGNPQALCYQFGGESSRGLGPAGSAENWRCVDLNKIQNVQALSGPWHTAPNHSRPQTCVAVIDVEVEH